MKLLSLQNKFCLLIAVFSILIIGCSKDDNVIVNPPPAGNDLKIKGNVKTIDTSAVLQSDSTQISQGVYIFQYQSTPPTISDNSIIVGIQGEGFLRKVSGTSISGNNLTLTTEDATMEDIFESGSFNFNIDFSQLGNDDLLNKITPQRDSKLNEFNSKIKKKDEKNLNQKDNNNFEKPSSLQSVSSPVEIRPGLYLENQEIIYHTDGIKMNSLWDFDFSNTTIYSNGILSITIPNGTASFKPNFEYDFEWGLTGIKKLKCLFNNAEFNTNFDVQFTASQPIQLLDEEKVLSTYRLHFIFWTPSVIPIPIRMITELKLVAKYNADLNSSITYKIGETNTNILSMGLNYDNGSWSDIYSNNNSIRELHKPTLMGTVNFSQSLKIIPKVSVKFYGIAGPYIAPYYYENFNSEVGSPNLDWQVKLTGGVAADVGAAVTIFGRTLADYSKHFEGPSVSWIVPSTIEINSGNNQQGQPNQQLSQPLKVIVKDNLGVGHPNVPVYFNITGGGGSVSNSQVLTNESGIAETDWTLGPSSGSNAVTSEIRKPNGTMLSSINFNASASDSIRIFAGTDGYGIYLTENNGTSWTHVLPIAGRVYDFAILNDNVFAGMSDPFKVYLSQNNGLNWLPSNIGLPATADANALASHDDIIIVGLSYEGAYLSQNKGLSWTPVNNGLPYQQHLITSFAFNNSLIFTGIKERIVEEGGVYVSQNNGANWIAANTGLPDSGGVFGLNTCDSNIFALVGAVAISSDFSGIYRSQNNGGSWILVNQNLPFSVRWNGIAVSGNNIYAGMFNFITGISSIYRSQNHGDSWTSVYNNLPGEIISIAAYGNFVIASGSFGIYLSQNNGTTWSPINNGLPSVDILSLAVKTQVH